MEYYKDNKIVIRDLKADDAEVIAAGERAQGWNASADKYGIRLKDAAEGRAVAMAAEYEGRVVGYINVYMERLGGAFLEEGVPEIVDFGVLIKYRRH